MYDAEHQKIKEILKKNGQQQPYKIIPVNEDNLAHIFKLQRHWIIRNMFVFKETAI